VWNCQLGCRLPDGEEKEMDEWELSAVKLKKTRKVKEVEQDT
jgi:hypothetical protein